MVALPAPAADEKTDTIILGTDKDGKEIPLSDDTRTQGTYIIGSTGSGKSQLIIQLVSQDIKRGQGVCVLDPHGSLVDGILALIPPERVQDVILLDIKNDKFPFSINLFSCDNPYDPVIRQITMDLVEHVFENILHVSPENVQTLEYLHNCTSTLIDNNGTMADILLLLLNDIVRQKLVGNVLDGDVKHFWEVYDEMKPVDRNKEASPVRRRVQQFLTLLTRPLVGKEKSTINMPQLMRDNKIILVKMDALRLEKITSLVGSLIIALILQAAPSREGTVLTDFNLYVDEVQRFATRNDFKILLQEARKYRIKTTIAHQALSQLSTDMQEACLQAGTLIDFRVGGKSAYQLAQEFDTSRSSLSTETKREPILSIHQNLVGWFQQGHGHSNPRVTEIVKKYLQPLFEDEKRFPRCLTARLGKINTFLVNVMEGKLFPVSNQQKEILLEEMMVHFYLSSLLLSGYVYGVEPRMYKSSTELEREYPGFYDSKEAILAFFESYVEKGEFSVKALENLEKDRFHDNFKGVFEEVMMKRDREFLDMRFEYQEARSKFSDDSKGIDEKMKAKWIDWEKEVKKWKDDYKKRNSILNEYPSLVREKYKDVLKILYTDSEWEDPINEAWERAKKDIQLIKDFITEWEELGRLFHADPILVPSGQYKETPIPRSPHEVLGEIGNILVNLPDRHAKVKIKGGDDPKEFDMETIDKEDFITEHGLTEKKGKVKDDFVEEVKEENIKQGYLVERKEIEKEIEVRQVKWMSAETTDLEETGTRKVVKPSEQRKRIITEGTED